MKQKITLILVAIYSAIFAFPTVSCGQTEKANPNFITIIQGSNTFIVSKTSDSIVLEKLPFSMRYFCNQYHTKKEKFYSAQIAVLLSKDDMDNINIGQKTDDIAFFAPGSGMSAPFDSMYESVFITNTGHHYLFYENEKSKRATLISKNKDLLELEWQIGVFNYEETDIKIQDIKFTELYFVVFIDHNLNNKIDEGELKKIKVIFK